MIVFSRASTGHKPSTFNKTLLCNMLRLGPRAVSKESTPVQDLARKQSYRQTKTKKERSLTRGTITTAGPPRAYLPCFRGKNKQAKESERSRGGPVPSCHLLLLEETTIIHNTVVVAPLEKRYKGRKPRVGPSHNHMRPVKPRHIARSRAIGQWSMTYGMLCGHESIFYPSNSISYCHYTTIS